MPSLYQQVFLPTGLLLDNWLSSAQPSPSARVQAQAVHLLSCGLAQFRKAFAKELPSLAVLAPYKALILCIQMVRAILAAIRRLRALPLCT